jgi:hypothetical protein
VSADIASTIRALVDEVRAERGDTDEYLIVDDLLKRLPGIADQAEAQADAVTADVLRRVKERLGRTPYAAAHINNLATELGVEL